MGTAKHYTRFSCCVLGVQVQRDLEVLLSAWPHEEHRFAVAGTCLNMSIHAPDFEADGQLSGMCVCGRKLISVGGFMIRHCKKSWAALAGGTCHVCPRCGGETDSDFTAVFCVEPTLSPWGGPEPVEHGRGCGWGEDVTP